MMFIRLRILTLLLALEVVHDGTCVQICEKYPSPDPCQPGGVWDPVLNSCTGYEGRPCYQCYSGPLCKTKEDTLSCNFSAYGGNPIVFAEYWQNSSIGADPCTSILGHYRPAYQFPSHSAISNAALPPLVSSIQRLHSITENAVTEGYHIVTGMGATMVIYITVVALTEKILKSCSVNCPDRVDVLAQVPYYASYPDIIARISTARWNLSADPNSPWTIEIVTYPNNPDGSKKKPLVKDPDHVITDMVYYWPMFTNIDQVMNKSIMIFSSSKNDGLAGTRFGWGLVRDPILADSMSDVASSIVIAQSADIELRVLSSLETTLSQGLGPSGLLGLHEYGRNVMYSRFDQLNAALTGCPALKLQNSLDSPGAYAWIHCDTGGPCADYFAQVNLSGLNGTEFGTSDKDIRFTMLLPRVEFIALLEKVKLLCS